MGESIKEGSIAAVLKHVGQPVREDEVIAQIETDKVTIDIKAPAAGVLQQLHVKPSDLVVAGQVVAVVGAGAGAPAGAAPAPAAAAAAASTSTSDRTPSIQFPPRLTASGVRISGLPEAEYAAALAEAEAKRAAAEAPATPAAAVETAAPPPPPAAAAPEYPMPAAKAAPPPFTKNKLQFVTRPDGRGGPPRRPLTERELEMINLGGVY